jgi:hypothetical protein
VIIWVFGGGMYMVYQLGAQAGPLSGLIGILVLVAAVILAFTGSYPRSIFDFVFG